MLGKVIFFKYSSPLHTNHALTTYSMRPNSNNVKQFHLVLSYPLVLAYLKVVVVNIMK